MIDPTAEDGPIERPTSLPDGAEPSESSIRPEPVLRPEARVVRADRSLAAMVLVICTLGGMGVGFGFAMYLMRAQLAYAPFSAQLRSFSSDAQPIALLGVWYDANQRGRGTTVQSITRGTAAERAGIVAGDLITSIDGQSVHGCDFREVVQTHEPGEIVPVSLERHGRPMILHARLGFR